MAASLLTIDVKGVKVPVVFEQEKRLPLASLELVFRDSGFLADGIPGQASMSAKLLNEGTKKEGAIAFATALENRAVSLHAGTGRETFVINLEALKSELPFALGKLEELLRDPNLTPEAFKKVQTQTLGEIERKKSDFDYIAAVNLRSILFEGTPLAHPSLGTEESVKRLTLDDLSGYLKGHLHLENVIVVMGGNFSDEEAKKIAAQAVAPLSHGTVKPIAHFDASGAGKRKVEYEETDQAYIYFGAPYRMMADDPKRVYGKVAAFILGSGGFGSRLMEEIRVKRGLAYSAYGRLVANKTHAYFSGYLQTKIESSEEAQKVVADVVEGFLKKGVTAEELEGAKKFFLGSEPLRTETLAQRMQRAFHEYYEGLGLGWSKKELKMIEEMKLEDLNAFIHAHPEIGELSWSVVTKK
ncbi:M16 family metallopeptidase [Nitratifractor sp.]